MVLLVDIGNTRVKWCCMENGQLVRHQQLTHHGDLTHLLEDQAWQSAARPGRVVLCSVLAAERTRQLSSWIEAHWGCRAEFVTPTRRAYGISNGYKEAQRLGADRWAALIGAHHTIAGAVCLFDCGTALTVDVLDASGRHHGGLIMPGLHMMRDALRQADALRSVLGDVTEKDALPLLATDTHSAIMHGTLHTMVAAMEHILEKTEMEQAHEVTPVITGGDAEVLLPLMARRFQYRPELVLQGLAVIAGGGV